MWTQNKQFNELNKIIATDQWFCYSVLLVKTEGPAVTAWESAVCQLLADHPPCDHSVQGWLCPRAGSATGTVGAAAPARRCPTPLAMQMLHTRDPSCVITFVWALSMLQCTDCSCIFISVMLIGKNVVYLAA